MWISYTLCYDYWSYYSSYYSEVELDASFNKAFPIIKQKIPKEYHKSCHSILRAAAFTYVVGVLKNIISLRVVWSVLSKIR